MKKFKVPDKVVIIRTDRIGEVLLASVSINSVRKRFPNAKISFITSEYSRPLLENRDDLDKLMVFDNYNGKPVLKSALALSKILKKERFDMAIVLNPHKILHLGCLLAGIPVRIGFDRKWGFTLNRKMKDLRHEGKKHEVEYTLELMNFIESDDERIMPRLDMDKAFEEKIRGLFDEQGYDMTKPYIALHAGSSNPVKIWPSFKYAELINMITGSTDINCVLLGTEKEKNITSAIIDAVDVNVLDLTGKLDLGELTCVLGASALFIGNDTGPTHMAAALRVPVISIFRNTAAGSNPARWRPYTEKAVVFHEARYPDAHVNKGLPCDYRRRDEVTAHDVMEAVREMLG
jgi:heptosyltransferase-2